MSNSLLNLEAAPKDPLERIMWLSGVQARVTSELETAFSEAYFNARIQRRLDAAISAGPHSRKRVLALTRKANTRKGRMVKWGDGADPSSTAYQG